MHFIVFSHLLHTLNYHFPRKPYISYIPSSPSVSTSPDPTSPFFFPLIFLGAGGGSGNETRPEDSSYIQGFIQDFKLGGKSYSLKHELLRDLGKCLPPTEFFHFLRLILNPFLSHVYAPENNVCCFCSSFNTKLMKVKFKGEGLRLGGIPPPPPLPPSPFPLSCMKPWYEYMKWKN